jgi:hypothetical protein
MKKMIIYKFLLLLVAGAFAFAACNKEEDPFEGKDSYITAFSLQQGEVVLHAAIAGEEIILTAPEGFLLTQAKAAVKLSENASIYPDPATVTDWDEERQFAVTAHNGTQTKYIYKVKRSGIAHDGTVALETQADVDAFGQQGVTLIDGNLTIGRTTGTDSITSLAPLAGLKAVTYNLTVNPTFSGASLGGLETLEHVGGTFQAGGTTTATALKHIETLSLPALKTVGNFYLQNTVTIIAELPELTSVSKQLSLNCPLYQLQLPSLQHAGTLTLTTANNSGASLARVALPALEEVDGILAITFFHSVTRIDLPVLKKAGGLTLTSMNLLSFVYAPQLEKVTNTVNLNVPALAEFGLPELKQAGAFYLSGAALSVLEFPKLTEVTTSLDLYSISAKGLAGFSALQTAGTITMYDLKDAVKIELPASVQHVTRLRVETYIGLPPEEIDVRGKNIDILEIRRNAVKAGKLAGDDVFHGTLVIDPTSATKPFPVFPQVVEGFREIDSLNVQAVNTDTVILSGIRKVNRGALFTTSYSGYPYHFSLPGLEEVGGTLNIYFPYMTNTAATFTVLEIPKLQRVGGDFTMNVIGKTIKELSFPELTAVGGNFTLTTGYNYSSYVGFETLSFPQLATVGGKLTIHSGSASYSNTLLKNLAGFAALAGVKAIEVTRQAALTDFTGLQNAFNSLASPSDWSATGNGYNPTYQNMLDGNYTN